MQVCAHIAVSAILQEVAQRPLSGTASSGGKLAKPVTAACISKEVTETGKAPA